MLICFELVELVLTIFLNLGQILLAWGAIQVKRTNYR